MQNLHDRKVDGSLCMRTKAQRGANSNKLDAAGIFSSPSFHIRLLAIY